MRITLPRETQRRLCRKQYIEVKTSFLTAEGPAVGTVWFDSEAPDDEPKIVDEVLREVDRVFFDENNGADSLGVFMDRVREGRYVLIGVVPSRASFTVT